MTTRLVYHTPESASGGVSPFDEAVIDTVTDGDVSIACPYFTLSYLKRITGLSKSWRVITDVEEWLALRGPNTRSTIQDFIAHHTDKIRHVSGLHSKAVIGSERALIGSANLTNAGILRRREISVLFEKEPQVLELQEWFDHLWSESTPIDLDELDSYIYQTRSTPSSRMVISSISLSSPKSVKSRFKEIAQSDSRRIGSLSQRFITDNLDSVFVAYSLVYIGNAISALKNSPDAEAVVIQPYESKKSFASARKAARLYRKITKGQSIPLLITPQGRMDSDGQYFQYGGRLWDILDATDREQLSIVEQNVDSGKWVLLAGDSLYSEKNLVVVERPIVELPGELPIRVARNIRRANQETVLKAVAIPAPKLINRAYTDVLEML